MQMVCMNKIKNKIKCELSGAQARDVRNLQVSDKKISADVRQLASAAMIGAAMEVDDDIDFDDMVKGARVDETYEKSDEMEEDTRVGGHF